MGLFQKVDEPESLTDVIYDAYSSSINDDFKGRLTPIQFSIYRLICDNTLFSFSAPTSAGKSFLFRELIKNSNKDIVIVVPSRALIAEYYRKIMSIVGRDVLVLQFVELINRKHSKRSIFIITPERGRDLFAYKNELDIDFILFDEAQISEEKTRGMTFDALVRRVQKVFPNAKKIFAHPFITNPEAQFDKHDFTDSNINLDSVSYEQNTVGKIFVSALDSKFYYFSPYERQSNTAKHSPSRVLVKGDLMMNILQKGGTVLVYVSKSNIYNEKCLDSFQRYIKACPVLKDEKALFLISQLQEFIGGTVIKGDNFSNMLSLMRLGIVIHHGSIPLKARLLLEEFVNLGYAKMCFATSTLLQGINMPFDLVYIDNFKFHGDEESRILQLKNLIGRAGRTTNTNQYDYGFVCIRNENVVKFSSRIKSKSSISSDSQISKEFKDDNEDAIDLVNALKNDSFNDELKLPDEQIRRLQNDDVYEACLYILNNFLKNGVILTGAGYQGLDKKVRKKIKESFQLIYMKHLSRELTVGEKSILSTAIHIMVLRIEVRSFSELVALRFDQISKKAARQNISKKLRDGEITKRQANRELKKLTVEYSIKAESLPNKSIVKRPIVDKSVLAEELPYDLVVYDTYDYLDKVIGLSLVDPLCAAFEMYHRNVDRADSTASYAITMKNIIRYGTSDSKEIYLLKYGFEFEDIEWLKKFVTSIDENEIVFDSSISDLNEDKRKIIDRYIYK